MKDVLFYASLTFMGLAAASGWFPWWKSARLSPDAIQRRSYWGCTVLAVVLVFSSQVPDWKDAWIASVAMAFGMTVVALRWTRNVKIRGRIYTADPANRGPDRPPVLRR